MSNTNSSFHCTSKVLNFIDTRPKDNEVKGAVKLDPDLHEYLDDSDICMQLSTSFATTFATFDKQDQPLSEFVKLLCTQLGITTRGGLVGLDERFSLMFEDRRRFVTERNKNTLQQGFILKLTASPKHYACHFLVKLESSTRPLSADKLSLFGSLCMDPAFAEAFHGQQGVQRLSNVIEEAADWHPFFDSNSSGSLLLGLMHALLQMVQLFPQIVPWPSLSGQFLRKIAFLVNGQSKLEQNDSRALALDMLLAFAEHCEHLYDILRREVPVDSLIRHLDNTDQRVLLGSLALINALYGLADREERISIVKVLHGRPFIASIGRILARECPSNSTALQSTNPMASPNTNSEMKNQLLEHLARLQHIRFDEVRALALRSPSDNEIEVLQTLDEFKVKRPPLQSDFVGDEFLLDAERDLHNSTLEFGHEADWEAFRQIVRTTPPGLLAICAILDIHRPLQIYSQSEDASIGIDSTNPAVDGGNQNWTKLQELDAHFIGRPSLFPQILAKLAKMLIQVLGICGTNSTVGQRFGLARQPRFWRFVLKCERPFYEMYRVLVELFSRTWREMNAKADELGKVFNVVQDQFERALFENPDSLEQLEMEMLRKRFSYFNVQKIWKREQLEQEELELNSEDIQPLRDHLRSEFERLVLQNRISLHKKGQNFQRILPTKQKESSTVTPSISTTSSTAVVHSSSVHSSSSSHLNFHQHPQYWFWRLDDRGKHFNFWDCRLSGGKPTELMVETKEKLSVAQIRGILHGNELVARLSQQHGIKMHKKGQNLLRFSFCLETENIGQQEYFLCAQNDQELANWLEAMNCLCWPQMALQNAGIRAEVDRLLDLEVHIRMMDMPIQKQKPPQVLELPRDLSWIPEEFL